MKIIERKRTYNEHISSYFTEKIKVFIFDRKFDLLPRIISSEERNELQLTTST